MRYVFLVLLIVGCTNKDAKNQSLPIVKVEKRDLAQRVTMQGTIESVSQQVVIAPYDGNVQKIFVKTGEKVADGAALVAVESSASMGTTFPLRASMAGTVTHVGVKLGEYVKGKNEEKVLVRLDDLGRLMIRAKISESDYPKLEIGQEAIASVQALPQSPIKGKVIELSMAPSEVKRWRGNESIQYEVLIRPESYPPELRPGMSVIVDALTAKKDGVLSLPHEYVQRKNRKFFVELGPHRESKEIQVGLQTDEFLEVKGLNEGDQVHPVDFYSDKKD